MNIILSVLFISLVGGVASQTEKQNSTYCSTPNNERGDCVLLEECDELFTLIKTKQLTAENVSYLRRSHCGFKQQKVLVCCKKNQPTTTNPPPLPPKTNMGSCLTPNNIQGQCTFLNKCNDVLSLLKKKPLYPEDISFLRNSKCGYDNGDVLVCCPPQKNITTSPIVKVKKVLLPEPGVCGNLITTKIYGGNRTQIDEYPWMALLEYSKPQDINGFHCGGSLISDRYVVTASHCVSSQILPDGWKLTGVRLGEWDLSTEVDCVREPSGEEDCADPYIDVSIERIIIHENYMPEHSNQINDIALLRLAKSIEFTDFIQPICLPSTITSRNSNFNDLKMNIAGWGRTKTQKQSNIKLKATVTVVDLVKCNQKYSERNVKLIDTQLCAGGVKGIDSCKGDSGGPLIGFEKSVPSQVYNILVGVVSFGPTQCGLDGWPGVYTRVGAYVDWIESNLQP